MTRAPRLILGLPRLLRIRYGPADGPSVQVRTLNALRFTRADGQVGLAPPGLWRHPSGVASSPSQVWTDILPFPLNLAVLVRIAAAIYKLLNLPMVEGRPLHV